MKKLSALFFCVMLTAVTLPNRAIAEAPPKPVKTAEVKVKKTKKPKKKVVLAPREIAQRASRSAGHALYEWRCLDMLWTKESHFNPKARNKSTGAYGIAQFMPQTWGNYKVKKTSDPNLQIKYGLRYIEKRYGSPCAAWKHWKRHHWY